MKISVFVLFSIWFFNNLYSQKICCEKPEDVWLTLVECSQKSNYDKVKSLISTKGNEKIVNQGIKTVDDIWCYISGTGVRMRELPSLKGKIVGYFKDGERVKRIGDPCGEGGWEYVERINATYGYVWGEYCHCILN